MSTRFIIIFVLFVSLVVWRLTIGVDNFSVFISIVTLFTLIWYTFATEVIKGQSVKQVEIQQMPVIIPFIRHVSEFNKELVLDKIKDHKIGFIMRGHAVTHVLRLRNVGKGAAFNVFAESKNLKIECENNFLAPDNDEQSTRVVLMGNKVIDELNSVNGEIIIISCRGVSGKSYQFKYKIKEVGAGIIEYLGVN